jgi:hypothetical protein
VDLRGGDWLCLKRAGKWARVVSARVGAYSRCAFPRADQCSRSALCACFRVDGLADPFWRARSGADILAGPRRARFRGHVLARFAFRADILAGPRRARFACTFSPVSRFACPFSRAHFRVDVFVKKCVWIHPQSVTPQPHQSLFPGQ